MIVLRTIAFKHRFEVISIIRKNQLLFAFLSMRILIRCLPMDLFALISLLFFLPLRSSTLSMKAKIKWNNLVFLMLICYLVAGGLIYHSNTNAVPYIHKFLLRNIKCIIRYRLLAHCAAISAHVIKWFMHSFNVEHSRRAGAMRVRKEEGESEFEHIVALENQ